MGTDAAAARRPDDIPARTFARAAAWLEREAAPVSLFCLAAAVAMVMLPHQLLLDGWLTLVAGREVVLNGLPAADGLTEWTRGADWIDQQWLAQAAFYGLWALGGVKLVMLAHVAVVLGALALGLLAARRLGASASNAARAGAAAVLVAPWTIQLRTQTLVLPLFVLVLWLLAADSRAPSRRVFLVLPVLVLWANLHGSVVMAAGLVAVRGVTSIVGSARTRRPLPGALALVLLPFVCVLLSPYATGLPRYYRSLFFNPALRELAPEWGAATPSVWTLVFYAVAGATASLLVRRRARLTAFEQAALLATMAAGALAIRSLVWFAVTALVLLPLLLDERPPRPARGRAARLAAPTALATAVLWTASALAQPGSWYTSSWPEPAADRVAVRAADPRTRVFSDGRFGDWLLWLHPELAGRVSHDVRWELHSQAQLRELLRFDAGEPGWRETLGGYDVLVLDNRTHRFAVRSLARDGRFETLWRDERLVVYARR